MQASLAREIRMRAADDRPVLSPRERAILLLTADGLSAPEIATRLIVSPATVRTHLQHLYDKLGVLGVLGVAALASRVSARRTLTPWWATTNPNERRASASVDVVV